MKTLYIHGINSDAPSYERVGDALVISHANGSTLLTIDTYFTPEGHLEHIVFDDAMTISIDDFLEEAADDFLPIKYNGNDTIMGTPQIDYLNGYQGDDVIYGLASNDWLVGGIGNDTLVGGLGSDQFIWNSSSQEEVDAYGAEIAATLAPSQDVINAYDPYMGLPIILPSAGYSSPAIDFYSDVEAYYYTGVQTWLDGTVTGDSAGANIGSRTLDTIADIDGDGVDDFIVSEYVSGASLGEIYKVKIISSLTGNVLAEIEGGDGKFGISAVALDDWNGDGYADIAIGAPEAGPSNGAISVYESQYVGGELSYLLIAQYGGTHEQDYFGLSMVAGDFDGDGKVDDLVTYNLASRLSMGMLEGGVLVNGYQKVLDGSTGEETTPFLFSNVDRVYNVGNVDPNNASNSNSDDYAVIMGATFPFGYAFLDAGVPFQLHVMSGHDGETIWSKNVLADSIAVVDDLDGDGVKDFVTSTFKGDVSDLNSQTDLIMSVVLEAYSSVDGSLLYSTESTTQALYLVGGLEAAGDLDGDGYQDVVNWGAIVDEGDLTSQAILGYSGLTGKLIYAVDSGIAFF